MFEKILLSASADFKFFESVDNGRHSVRLQAREHKNMTQTISKDCTLLGALVEDDFGEVVDVDAGGGDGAALGFALLTHGLEKLLINLVNVVVLFFFAVVVAEIVDLVGNVLGLLAGERVALVDRTLDSSHG